jgi:hypothetical protein
MYFGSVRLGKAYVTFHLMPLYMCPVLVHKVPPGLKRRMQGKTSSTSRLRRRQSVAGAGNCDKEGVHDGGWSTPANPRSLCNPLACDFAAFGRVYEG